MYPLKSTLIWDDQGRGRGCSDALGRLIEVDEPGVASIGAQAKATVDIGAMNSRDGGRTCGRQRDRQHYHKRS
jgi:hypothetical protein